MHSLLVQEPRVFVMLPSTLSMFPAICHVCIPQVFGFFATIVFAIDFYLIFNEVAKFLKQGDSANETTAHETAGGEWPLHMVSEEPH